MTPAWQPVLAELYGPAVAESMAREVQDRLNRARSRCGLVPPPLSEKDAWLITYADQFQERDRAPLAVLQGFLDRHTVPWITGVHVLPFYPWSSDDGFSITDYTAVNEAYGGWAEVTALADGRRLMADAVINHMSAQSQWFHGFLDGAPEFAGFFKTADPAADLSATVRPRTTPLLTRFAGRTQDFWVWTTFSADQVDLDYGNPAVLLRILDVLLEYVSRGASAIRLDAVGFLWKEEGTSSIHLPQTHAIVHFLRQCLEEAAPGTLLVTETNVPHAENVSYFGSSTAPEAHLVYQFPLAPLVLDAMLEADGTALATWASDLAPPVSGTSFLNFLASHDGVGVRPVEGLIPDARIIGLAEAARRAGGGLGERTLQDGSIVPYELNSTWFDLMAVGYTEEQAIARHLASHAVMFALTGVPLLYVHSLFGSSNDATGFRATGRPRSYNREKFTDVSAVETGLANETGRIARVFSGIRRMAAARAAHPAFHPFAQHVIRDAPPSLLAVERDGPGGRALVVVNLSGDPARYELPPGEWADLPDGARCDGTLDLAPWRSSWVQAV